MTGPGVQVRRLESLCRRRVEIESAVVDTVAAARATGASWSTIGAALGVSTQAAQQRYGATSKGQEMRGATAAITPRRPARQGVLKHQGALNRRPKTRKGSTP